MAVTQIALDHYRERAQLAREAADALGAVWARIDRSRIAASWEAALPTMVRVFTTVQEEAAGRADRYVRSALAEQRIAATTGLQVAPRAFAGIASDGRDLESLLYQPAITALTAIRKGRTLDEAMAAGRFELDMIARTQVADAGRVADGVAIVGQDQAQGYTRALSPPSCDRCIVLAGRFYRWNTGFNRHPRCDCVHVPGRDTNDVIQSPRQAFDAMTRDEQDRAFTRAGAAAIRDGADISQVVNARRGMYTASVGGRNVLATTEGTTVRAGFGRANRDAGTVRRPGQRVSSTRRVRLMPEQIYEIAGDNRDEALRLLRSNGYLVDVRRTVPAPRQAPRRSAFADRVAAGERGRRQLGGGVQADTQLVTLQDGSTAVWKRAKDSSGRPAVEQQDAEELGALIARTVGLRAPEVVRASQTDVYMSHLDGETFSEAFDDDFSAAARAIRDSDDGQRLGLADLLMGNTDRNGGNLLVHEGRIGAIDHGSAFQWHDEYNNPARPPEFDHYWYGRFVNSRREWRDANPLSRGDVDELGRRLTALRPEFARLSRLDWHDAMMVRLRTLADRATGRGILT